MQHPVGIVGTRIERLDKAEIDEDPHDQHAAIDAVAAHIGAIVIGSQNPFARFRHDAISFVALALFGFGHGQLLFAALDAVRDHR
jgi:hypothetical protein